VGEWCRAPPDEKTDLAQVICYNYTTETPIREGDPNTTANDRIVLVPNQQIIVRVLRAKTAPPVTIALGGTPGETKLRLDGEILVAGTGSNAAPAIRTFNDALYPSYTLYEARFVPRTPGFVVLSLTTTPAPATGSGEQAAQASVSETTTAVEAAVNRQTLPQIKNPGEYTYSVAVQMASNGAVDKTERTGQVKWNVAAPAPQQVSKTFEFLVPNVYSGALRVGVSAVLGLDEHVYTKRQAPGVNVMEVLDHGAPAAEAELVVGYAPYWQAFKGGGRDYIRHYKGTAVAQRLAPYLGLAIVSATPGVDNTRVRWLRSFYLGAEWEFFQNTSIALAVTLSRVDVLAPNLTAGGPIGKDTALTDSEVHPGFGIVINFSPDFFKFAAGFK
jgi:hypothetical protein